MKKSDLTQPTNHFILIGCELFRQTKFTKEYLCKAETERKARAFIKRNFDGVCVLMIETR